MPTSRHWPKICSRMLIVNVQMGLRRIRRCLTALSTSACIDIARSKEHFSRTVTLYQSVHEIVQLVESVDGDQHIACSLMFQLLTYERSSLLRNFYTTPRVGRFHVRANIYIVPVESVRCCQSATFKKHKGGLLQSNKDSVVMHQLSNFICLGLK